jgi:hypothetical protein
MKHFICYVTMMFYFKCVEMALVLSFVAICLLCSRMVLFLMWWDDISSLLKCSLLFPMLQGWFVSSVLRWHCCLIIQTVTLL